MSCIINWALFIIISYGLELFLHVTGTMLIVTLAFVFYVTITEGQATPGEAKPKDMNTKSLCTFCFASG